MGLVVTESDVFTGVEIVNVLFSPARSSDFCSVVLAVPFRLKHLNTSSNNELPKSRP